MKKKQNSKIITIAIVLVVAVLISACNRGTGCPTNMGLILPLF